MQVAIEVSHTMQSFSGKNSFLGSAANLSDVYLYQPDLGGRVKKIDHVFYLLRSKVSKRTIRAHHIC